MKYILSNFISLDKQDLEMLNLVYYPILQSNSINLYFFLSSLFYKEEKELDSNIITSHLCLSEEEVNINITRLSAIGLITKYKPNYIYLNKPKSPHNFFNDPSLYKLFKDNSINSDFLLENFSYLFVKENREKIEDAFNKVFICNKNSTTINLLDNVSSDLLIETNFDISVIYDRLKKDGVDVKFDKNIESRINNLFYIYSLTYEEIYNFIYNNLSNNNFILNIKLLENDVLKDKTSSSSKVKIINSKLDDYKALFNMFNHPKNLFKSTLNKDLLEDELKYINNFIINSKFSQNIPIINAIVFYTYNKIKKFNYTYFNKIEESLLINNIDNIDSCVGFLYSKEEYLKKSSNKKDYTKRKRTTFVPSEESQKRFEQLLEMSK